MRGKALDRTTASAGAIVICVLLAGGCTPRGDAAPADPRAAQNPSGLPVPRYVTLKSDPVKARSGPSDDHRVLFSYRARGLPVQVVGETKDWRRICDSDGQLSWVNKLTTDGRRAVMRTQAGAAPILARPRDDAPVTAYLAHAALASLDHCQGGWCKIKVGGVTGWISASAVWGVAEGPQCR
jgi:SH3-like domain-containing protein